MESLNQLLPDFPFVTGYEVLKFDRTQNVLRLKIVVNLRDGSQLFLSEASTPRGFRYAYHWQDTEGRLIARWDNAPHHHTIETFPAHMHVGSKIEPATQPTVREVLEYLAQHFNA